MSKIYDKPFKTYSEQLEKIKKEYELQVPDDKLAIEFLKTLSYYNLINAYQDKFLTNGKYQKDINLNLIIFISIFEKSFLTIIFKYSTYVEEIFKTKLAYTISNRLGVDEKEYLKKKNYKVPKCRMSDFYKTQQALKKSLGTNDMPTKHYKNNHTHIPAWILFKKTYFNVVIDLFTFLQKDMQDEVIDDYKFLYLVQDNNQNKLKSIKRMLTTIRKFRNKIAHNAKVSNFKLNHTEYIQYQWIPEITSLFPFFEKTDTKNGVGEGDLYSAIFAICVLLDNSILRKGFLQEILTILSSEKTISDTYIEMCNFPKDILKRIEKIEDNLMN